MSDPAALEAERREQRRRALSEYANDRWLAHATLFPHRHRDAPAEAHPILVRHIHAGGSRALLEGFRRFGKTTFLEEAAILMAAFRECHHLVLVGASFDRAAERLGAIKREIEINDRLEGLFGPLKGPVWQERKIVLSNGVCIQAIGRDQSMLGIKHNEWRPDAGLVDDVEDPEEIRTDMEREKTWTWFIRSFLPAMDDALLSWVRVLGTRRGKGSLPERLENAGWPTLKIPIEHIDEAGERRATWPARFPLAWIDEQKSTTYKGDLHTWAQEYMCQAVSETERTFPPARIVPRSRRWEATYGFIDPASTVNRGSATTGWAVWSWIGPRLVVWESGAEKLMPDKIVALAYELLRQYDLTWLGVERDGLNQFLMQPMRAEQIKRGLAAVPLRPVAAISGTKGGGKLAFIRGLQPFFASGEVEFAKPQPDLEKQLLSFPYGPIDAPNALAYAQMMRPGLPVFDNFTEANIVEGLEPAPGKPLFLAANADNADGLALVTAALCQRAEGEIRVLVDWVCEGSPAELVAEIAAEAALLAETGEWVERKVIGDDGQPYKMPVSVRTYARHSSRWIVPAWHRDSYRNVGLMQAVRAIPQAASATEATPERARATFAALHGQQHQGHPKVLVSPLAKWTLRALSGGYARAVGRAGLAEAQPEAGAYRVLMEGIESFAGVGGALDRAAEDTQPIAYNRAGVAYKSAMPTR